MYQYRIGKKCVKELQQNLFTAQGVQPSSQIPRQWQQFLRSEENKQELVQFLAQCIYPCMKKNRSSQLKARISCVALRVTKRRIWLHVLVKKRRQG